jgi:hypothetical protein
VSSFSSSLSTFSRTCSLSYSLGGGCFASNAGVQFVTVWRAYKDERGHWKAQSSHSHARAYTHTHTHKHTHKHACSYTLTHTYTTHNYCHTSTRTRTRAHMHKAHTLASALSHPFDPGVAPTHILHVNTVTPALVHMHIETRLLQHSHTCLTQGLGISCRGRLAGAGVNLDCGGLLGLQAHRVKQSVLV